MALTIVLPVYNEAGNLPNLIGELLSALDVLQIQGEILIVDDASTDDSAKVSRHLATIHDRVQLLSHQRNYGQSAALATGIARARGDLIVTLDADGQHDPADLPTLFNGMVTNCMAVCGVRTQRHDKWIRRFSSRVANGFRNWVTGDRITDAGCTFRLIRREALAEIPFFNGTHRFLPTLLRFQGFSVKEVPVHHRPRLWGVSKYGIRNRLFRGIVDCLAIRWFKKRAFPGRRLNDDN